MMYNLPPISCEIAVQIGQLLMILAHSQRIKRQRKSISSVSASPN